MKIKLAFLALALGFTSMASAADLDTCERKIYDNCARRMTVGLSYIMGTARDCKFVRNSEVRSDITALIGRNRLTGVDLDRCTVSDYTFQSGDVVENKVFEGRLFVVLSSGRVVMLGRNNSIYELQNADNEPYESVTGLKINQSEGTITLERGRSETVLTLRQIQKRIDDGKIEPIAYPR